MIKNIIFDWSGTLSDDLYVCYEAAMTSFEEFGAKRIPLEQFRKEFVLPFMNFYNRYIPNMDVEKGKKIFLEKMNSLEPPKPFPGAHELLGFLSKKGIKMAILSSHPSVLLEKELKDDGFLGFFIHFKGGVRDKKEKIMELINECGFNGEETAYIGDMVHDIEAGKKAGVKTIAVTWGYKPKEVLANAHPDFLFESFDEIHDFISEQK